MSQCPAALVGPGLAAPTEPAASSLLHQRLPRAACSRLPLARGAASRLHPPDGTSALPGQRRPDPSCLFSPQGLCIFVLICYGASRTPGYSGVAIFEMIFAIVFLIVFTLGLHKQITVVHWGWSVSRRCCGLPPHNKPSRLQPLCIYLHTLSRQKFVLVNALLKSLAG